MKNPVSAAVAILSAVSFICASCVTPARVMVKSSEVDATITVNGKPEGKGLAIIDAKSGSYSIEAKTATGESVRATLDPSVLSNPKTEDARFAWAGAGLLLAGAGCVAGGFFMASENESRGLSGGPIALLGGGIASVLGGGITFAAINNPLTYQPGLYLDFEVQREKAREVERRKQEAKAKAEARALEWEILKAKMKGKTAADVSLVPSVTPAPSATPEPSATPAPGGQ